MVSGLVGFEGIPQHTHTAPGEDTDILVSGISGNLCPSLSDR